MVINTTNTPHNFSFDNSRRMQKYPLVHNSLREQDEKPYNQTYTIGSNTNGLRQSTSFRQQRSGSVDSDFVEYGHQITSKFPRAFKTNIPCRKPTTQSQTITRMLSNQLPLIDGYSANNLCCQRPWSKTQFELADFKKTLKQIN